MITLSVCKSLKFVVWERVNPAPNDKIMDRTKQKPFETKQVQRKYKKIIWDG